MRIDGDGIFLTSISYDDAEDIVRWRNSDEIQKHFIYRQKFTVEGQHRWIKEKVEPGLVAQFIIWDKQTNTKIGAVYLRDIDKVNKKCEYGIFIGESDYIGKGIGKECYRLMFDYAFNTLGLNKMCIRIISDNMRSIKCAEKMGFKVEGTFVGDIWLDEKPVDVVYLAKFRG